MRRTGPLLLSPVVQFQFGDIGAEQFFAEYWRKKPLHVKGIAREVLGFDFSQSRFRTIIDRLDRDTPELVNRTGDGTIFAQNMDTAADELRDFSMRASSISSCKRVWFDGVYAVDDSGIGSHYDHSDNFVLQQTGTKIWRLNSPAAVPQEELRERMLDVPETGLVYMPDDALEFVVEAGDVLYIPLFWAHWGVSAGPSLSVSVVYNADSPLDTILPALRGVLSEQKRWWFPQPVLPKVGDPSPGESEVDAFIDDLVDSLSSETFRDAAKKAMRDVGYRSAPKPAEPSKQSIYTPRGHRADLIDPALIAALIEAPVEAVSLDVAVRFDAPEDTIDALLTATTRGVLRQLGQVSARAAAFLHDGELRDDVRRTFGALEALGPEGLAEAMTRPEIMAWVWRASEAIESHYVRRIEAVFRHLTAVVAPYLIAADALDGGHTLRVERTSQDGLHVLPLGALFEIDGDGPLTLSREPEGYLLEADGASSLLVSPGSMDVEVGRSRALPKIGNASILGGHRTLSALLPIGRRFGCAEIAGATDALIAALPAALERIAARSPLLAAACETQTSVIMQRNGPGFGSSPPLRGLIALPLGDADLVAGAWIREMAHDRFNAIAEAFSLLQTPNYERFEAPFATEPRPMIEHLRYVFGASLGDCGLDPIARRTLDVIEAAASLTPSGARLVELMSI